MFYLLSDRERREAFLPPSPGSEDCPSMPGSPHFRFKEEGETKPPPYLRRS